MAAPVFEQGDQPGGICRSYYVRPGEDDGRHKLASSHDSYSVPDIPEPAVKGAMP